MKKKNRFLRIAFLETLSVFIVLILIIGGVFYWASQAEDSELAQSIRQMFEIPEPTPRKLVEPVVAPEPVEEAMVAAKPEPEAVVDVVKPEPAPLPSLTMEALSERKHLWPKELFLTLSKRVPVNYNGNDYGYMEFSEGMRLRVTALRPNGEVLGSIDGNYLSLSVHETNFVTWFEENYADRYDLEPIVFDDMRRFNRARFRIGTERGDAEFWSEMRIWCHTNYESVSLEIGEDTLIFLWIPQEEAPIDYEVEAREIARKYLELRNKYGSSENYAACEIQNPATGEVMGSSSMFIPRY